MTDPFRLLDHYAEALLARFAVSAGGTIRSPLPRHRRLVEALAKAAAALDASLMGGDPAGEAERRRAAVLDQAPALGPHVALLEGCAAALGAVLSGELAGTDVLFPGGTMDRVAPIYDGTVWTDHFNRLAAEAVARMAEALIAEDVDQPRIIEIGAGTGGTTRPVLQALGRFADRVTYDYTDVSPGFAAHGRMRFGTQYPFARFRVLDIEKPPAGQGFTGGAYHLVVATNVLHATRRIDAALGHVAALLAPGGALVLNEVTRASLFGTMTFGLLDGWWRFEDAGMRLPGAPLLDRAGWVAALEAAGFAEPACFGWQGAADSFQTLFLAEWTGAAEVAAPPVRAAPVVAPVLARVLGMDLAEIEPDRPLAEFGVDSIVAARLATALAESLGVALAPSEIYDAATLAGLERHIAGLPAMVPARAAEPDPPQAPDPPDAPDDIAVIGIACRFPGAADREAFWRNLIDGVCSITEVPAERWDWRPHFAAGRGDGHIVSRWGGFLDGHDLFDPEPFRITHGEARAMSPQQRLFLETAWHALEDAGYGRAELAGTKCGVFVGVAPDGWGGERADARSSLGDSNAILSARLAYALDLKGACLPIDTACSSSLVAVHMAARSLLARDTTMALAGGVSVLMGGPRLHAFLSDSGMASPTGLCRSFDAGADGFVPGEGVGVVVLKRLDRARTEGDQIYAVIKASGVNQDGTTSGITAPSGAAQTTLEREVYARGGIDARSIGLVEAHGTGTQLGDPIEVKALLRAFRTDTDDIGFCRIGSVKSNIGHTLTAAGIAGFIKAALAVGRGLVPPSLHYQVANPEIDFAASPFRVPTTAEPWPEEAGRPRLAAVSAFGFSGTNAHVVLAEPPPRRCPPPRPGPRLVAVSAKTAEALDRRLADLADFAATACEPFPWLAWTATVGRTHFEHRAAILAADGGAFSVAARALSENRGSPLGRRVVVSARQEALGAPVVPETPAMAAEAFLAGRPADLAAVFDRADRIRISLPVYPFERLHFPGITPRLDGALRSGRHPFVGLAEESAHGRRFPLIGADRWPGLADHRHGGRAIWPAAALIEAMWAAGRRIGGWGEGFALDDLAFVAPLGLGDRAWLVADPDPEGGLSLRLLGAGGRLHASGRLRSAAPVLPRRIDLPVLDMAAGRRMDASAAYAALAAVGFDYGPAFRMLRGVTVHEDRVLADLAPDDAAAFDWPPGRTDAAIQAAVGLAISEFEPGRMTVVPAGVARVRLHDGLTDATHALVERRAAEPGQVQLDISLLGPDGRVLAEMIGLRAAIRAEAPEAGDAVLAYEPVWRPDTQPPGAVPPADAARFAVLCLDGAIPLGAGARQILDPCADAAAWQARFGALAAAGMLPDRIADLRPLAAPPSAGADAAAAEAAVQAVTALLSGWLLAVPGRPLRLIRAYRTEGETVPAEAALEGLAGALAQEAPDLSLSLLGLDAASAAAPMAALAAAFARPGLSHARLRRGALTLRGWHPLPPTALPAATWPDRPVVIITGAQGGLGRASAEHLARTRQARLVLLSRRSSAAHGADRGADPGSDLARRIARLGGEAVDVSEDVVTPEGARRAVRAALTAFGRVDAVIHAAGVTRDGLLRGRAPADITAVLAPKVAGTMALLEALAGQPLRAFICYGSLAAVFGNAGQGDYGAANAFMGALAECRGLPLVTIDWPFWRDGSLKARDGDDARLRQATGTRWLETAEGLAMLDLALAAGRPRLAVAAGTPGRIAALFAGETPAAASPPTGVVAADRLEWLRDLLAEVTGAPPLRLRAEREIGDLALDSMHVMQLNDRLEQVFGRISKTLFYECRTLGEVAARLPAEARRPVSPAPAEPRPAEPCHDDRGSGPPRPVAVEPIAIIGMAGRFPGAEDLDSYWANLLAGRDCVTAIPPDRWDHSLVFDPTPGRPGKAYSRWGGFLSQVDGFDPLFFGIAPAEAEGMDPQERLALETAWEAMEDAGLTRATLARAPGRLGAVYVGVMYGDYQMLGAEQHARGNPVGASAPYWSIANRLSYAFDLRGPSLAVDSACSSSLTALHLACRSLWSGEAEVALAGGVNLSLHPLKYVGLSQGRFASTDGRCRSFAAGGDGYVPGEGVAIAILKLLAAARADGDRIHGVIRGSAVNHGGRTNGYTVPSPAAQAEAVRGALAAAGMGPADVDYVEAHGTGTALGDPIEVEGLGRLFAAGPDAGACPVGTVKSAIGHLEAAAGMAGLAKLLLQFRHATLAPTLLHGGANPAIDFAGAGLRLVTEAEAWQPRRPGRALTAGLSSFGAGGANAHVILEAPPPAAAPSAGPAAGLALAGGPFVFVVSARTLEQLQAYAERLRGYCASADAAVADVARTLQLGREAMVVRLGFLADSLPEAAGRLAAWLSGDRHAVDWHVPADETALVPAFDPAGSPQAVLSAWVRGASVPWAALDWPGRRVFVPPHPFMRRRYWPRIVAAAASPHLATPHIGTEVRLDPRAADLDHHRVAGRPLVPAAWLLALARTAGGSSTLIDVVLHRTTAGGDSPLLMRMRREGAALRIENEAGDVVLSAAVAEAAAVTLIPPPAARGTLPPAEAYRRFAALGINYGPSFRRLGTLVFDGQVAEAEITPATAGDSDITGLDAAMQAVIALIPEAPGVAGVPHRIERVIWHADPQTHPIARARARGIAADCFDVDGLSASGEAVVSLRGLRVRRLASAGAEASPAILVPVWHEAAARAGADLPRHLLILHGTGMAALAEACARIVTTAVRLPLTGPDEDAVRAALLAAPAPVDALVVLADAGVGHDAVAAEAERSALGFLAVARALARCPAGRRPARLVIVTAGLHDVIGGDAIDPAGAALPAMARSLAAELPGLAVVLADLDPAGMSTETARRILAEPPRLPIVDVAWRGGRRFERRLARVGEVAVRDSLPPEPVCLITGGGGGLGRALAAHLAGRYGAQVVLCGRRPVLEDSLPRRVDYVPADVRDAAAVARLAGSVAARHGRIDAIFHAPLVLADRRLAQMSADDFLAAFAPKAAGTAHILAAARQYGARLVVFSSANVFAGAEGQANYVAGSAVQDALALSAGGQTQVINWGLWGEIGAVADPATQARLAEAGIQPIRPVEGFAALDRILATALPQAAVVKAKPDALARLGLRAETPDLGAAVASFDRLETYGRARLLAIWAAAAGEGSRAYTAAGLARRLGIVRRHERLFQALLAMLERHRLIETRDGVIRLPAPGADPVAALAEAEAGLDAAMQALPWLAQPRALLDAVLGRYGAVLAGAADPLDVLFPGGSIALAEGAYRGNPLADALNAAAAGAVAAHRRAAGPGWRAIEIGAGSGGTTGAILAALDQGITPDGYLYTDLSRRFLAHGQAAFGQDRPWFTTALYDAEQSAEANGQTPGTFDAVIAANVLHATADIGSVLASLRRLLRPGGLLVMLELIAAQDYATLVFGLTEGWWKGADASRMAHSPVIDAAGWERHLAEAGFTGVERVDFAASGARGQAVFLASAPALPAAAAAAAPPPAGGDRLRQALLAHLRDVFGAVLRIDPAEMRAADPFEQYGLESLSATAIRDRLAARFGPLSPTLLFEHGTLASLADHLLAERGAAVRDALGLAAEASMAASPAIPAPEIVANPARAPAHQPVAIIGMAGRFPGAEDLDAFWRLLETGGSAIGPVPADRWAPDGRLYTTWGGFLAEIDRFDPLFFGIAPADAAAIDPQERLFLETAWHAMEDAGYTPARLNAGGPVGVYVGVMNAGYQWLAAQTDADAPATSAYWSIANRLSFVADFAGPSLAVDTACSASLTALHLAVQALRTGDCAAAVVGGVNLILHPRQMANLCEARMLSAGSENRAFGAGADGFVDGEGVAALLLKPLDAALASGDRIAAVIRATAINSGGRTAGFSVPSPAAQARVIAAALRAGGVAPESVGFVEAHGTGTALGDPIEVTGIAAAYGGGARPFPLALGALKANIGHLESAAGIAGVIKTVLQFRHGRIAPLRHAAQPNPLIDFAAAGCLVPQEATPWPAATGPDGASLPRRAGVSAFGAGGANAHAILEEAPPRMRAAPTAVARDILTLSAADAAALRRLAASLRTAFDTADRTTLADRLHSLRIGRRTFPRRVAAVVTDAAAVLRALDAVAAGESLPGLIEGRGGAVPSARPIEETPEGQRLLDAMIAAGEADGLAGLWVDGVTIDWSRLPWAAGCQVVALPGYPFARERYWLAGTASPAKPAALIRLMRGTWVAMAGAPAPAMAAPAERAEILVLREADPSAAAHVLFLALQDMARRPGRGARLLVAAEGVSAATVGGLAALARSAAEEGLHARILWLPAGLDPEDRAVILAEEAAASGDEVLIDRRAGRQRWSRQWLEEAGDTVRRPLFRSGGRYLMVGGLGEVGRALAAHLAALHGATIGIIGRTAAGDATRRHLDTIRGASGSAFYAAADVTDRAALARAVAELKAAMGGIDGVLDLARLLDNAPIARKSAAAFADVLAVKTLGTLHLDAVMAEERLDFFIVFSSLAAWFGLAGGADYAAACAIQEALMAERAARVAAGARHGVSLAVAWPQWRHDTALDAARGRRLEAAGLAMIDAAAGLAILDRAAATGDAVVAVVAGTPEALAPLAETPPDPLEAPLEALSDEALAAYVDALRAAATPVAVPVAAATTADRVRDAFAAQLRVDPLRIGGDSLFAEFGLDSIKALHVAERLSRDLGIAVEPAVFFDHPTVAQLAEALDERRGAMVLEPAA